MALNEAVSPVKTRKGDLWTIAAARAVIDRPLLDLLYEAQTLHRRFFRENVVEKAQLLSIKTGGCPEDCGYCSQSAHHDAPVKATALMGTEAVVAAARRAKDAGAARFCMGAAWREVKDRDMERVCAMVAEVKALGLETCMTLGMLREDQAERLAEAGLDFYNHNIDTAPDRYDAVVTTRTFEDRLRTLEAVRKAGVGVCCGGIIGMGENRAERADMLRALANLETPPESVPINALMAQPGTPMADMAPLDDFEMVRTVAAARIMMPGSVVRLSAGRETMAPTVQALCFMAGANSIFVGDRLLTAGNPAHEDDDRLFDTLGLVAGDVNRSAAPV